MRKLIIQPNFKIFEEEIERTLSNFDQEDDFIVEPGRNAIVQITLANREAVVKSFKIPNLINQIAYRFFRKSKAERSFLYATKLQNLNIGTPSPIAYQENTTTILFKDSYYICEYLKADYTYRDLTFDFNIPHWEEMLRGFTRFTYQLHKNEIEFLDHSPGNTLIKKEENQFNYYLVDLNRMKFGPMDFYTRIKNFARLTTHKEMVKIMSDEYAKCSGENFDDIFNLMWKETMDFQERFHRKRKLKKKLLFWRSRS